MLFISGCNLYAERDCVIDTDISVVTDVFNDENSSSNMVITVDLSERQGYGCAVGFFMAWGFLKIVLF